MASTKTFYKVVLKIDDMYLIIFAVWQSIHWVNNVVAII